MLYSLGHVTRNRPSSKMTKYVECWGADRPFANIAESKLVKNIGLAVSKTISHSYQFLREMKIIK